MSQQILANIVIGIAVLGLVIYRQLRTRRIDHSRALRLPMILCLIGLVETIAYVAQGGTVGTGHLVAAVVGLVVAALLAYPRAMSMRMWVDETGQHWMRGTWLTKIGRASCRERV